MRAVLRCIPLLVLPTLLASLWLVPACGGDDDDEGVKWFDCDPVLERVAECNVLLTFDDVTEADPEVAYDSCQFAHGNQWKAMFRCYKVENDSCREFAECLPDHGFLIPGEDGNPNTTYPDEDLDDDDDTSDDDTSDDDTADDDTSDDDTSDDDSVDDDTSDDDTADDDSADDDTADDDTTDDDTGDDDTV